MDEPTKRTPYSWKQSKREMRKFLFIAVNDGISWGGSEVLWSAAAEKLARKGHDVRISTKDWGKPVPQIEQLRSAGCQIFHRRPPSFISRQARKILPLREYASTHIRSIAQDVDLVFISQGANADGLAWMETVQAAGLTYALVAHGAAEQWWPTDDVAERLAKAYSGAIRAYFVSQANVSLSRRQFASPLLNAQVVQNPFNVPYDTNPPWPGDPASELLLACVARLDTGHKGQDILLEVLSLPRWRERNVRLSFVGTGVNERGLRHYAEQLGLKNVVFAGHASNIEEVWSKYHAMVLTSRYEGMPLALVEAMLCGRAPIVTDVASHAELVRDGLNGFLAKAPTIPFVDEALNRAWDARANLREMGKVAARDIRKWVSRDPAEDFANQLEGLVHGN